MKRIKKNITIDDLDYLQVVSIQLGQKIFALKQGDDIKTTVDGNRAMELVDDGYVLIGIFDGEEVLDCSQ